MEPLFQVRGLSVQLGGRWIYQGLDLAIQGPGLTGIIGPNGCGKSTLLRCLGGMLRPTAGAVWLQGQAVGDLSPRGRAQRLAFLPQEPVSLPEMTVEGLVSKGRTPWRRAFRPMMAADRAAVAGAIAATGLEGSEGRALGSLSGGQRQRAWLAMALAQETGVILLDEPTSYLDLPHQLRLLGLLQQLARGQGRRVVMVLHDLNLACRFCDEIVGLAGGQVICQGPPDQAMTGAAVAGLYGIRAQVAPDPVFGRPVVYPME